MVLNVREFVSTLPVSALVKGHTLRVIAYMGAKKHKWKTWPTCSDKLAFVHVDTLMQTHTHTRRYTKNHRPKRESRLMPFLICNSLIRMLIADANKGPPRWWWGGSGRGSIVSSKYLQSQGSDDLRRTTAALRDCCLLTAGAREQIPGWHYVSARRTKMRWEEKRGVEGGGRGNATLWLGNWSSLSLQHTGVVGSRASLHTVSFFFSLSLLKPSSFPFYWHAYTILSRCNSCCSSAVFLGETN